MDMAPEPSTHVAAARPGASAGRRPGPAAEDTRAARRRSRAAHDYAAAWWRADLTPRRRVVIWAAPGA